MHTLDDLRSGRLKGTRELHLSAELTEFPREILDLADTLKVLNLTGNRLSALPDDFGRLSKLKILFLSNNAFEVLPAVLADCEQLGMIGLKANQIHTFPENAVPENTHWLILTDNRIEKLPESIGRLTRLRKFMMGGNRLSDLPASMSNCQSIELLRLSANRFETLPDLVFDLPRLAWFAFAGNPLHKPFADPLDLPEVSLSDLELHDTLGQGASGIISRASWINPPAGLRDPDRAIAYKAYKGAVTSDGFAQDEMQASLAAGYHPNLVELVARIRQDEATGLVMGLIDPSFGNLGNPPTFDSCTRDDFDADFRLSAEAILKISRSMADSLAHLRQRGICHGDIYAHNIMINPDADTLFGDFGAGANYASLPEHQAEALEKIEVRAFGCLIEDLLGCLVEGDNSPLITRLDSIRSRCMNAPHEIRPTFEDLKSELDALQ